MKIRKLNQAGIAHTFILLFVIVAVAIVGVYMLVRSHAMVSNPNPLNIMGTVVKDGCANLTLPISSTGCDITIAGNTTYSSITPTNYVIKIVPSTADKNYPYGKFVGFGTITTDYTGYPVSVNAYLDGSQLTSPGSPVTYEIASSDNYYVQIMAQKITGTITADGCYQKASSTQSFTTVLAQLEQNGQGCVMNVNGSTTLQLFPTSKQVSQGTKMGQLQNFFTGETATYDGALIPQGLVSTDYTGYQISFFAAYFPGSAQPNSVSFPEWSIIGNSNYFARIILPNSSSASGSSATIQAVQVGPPLSSSQIAADCSSANPAQLPAVVLNSPNCKLIVPLLL